MHVRQAFAWIRRALNVLGELADVHGYEVLPGAVIHTFDLFASHAAVLGSQFHRMLLVGAVIFQGLGKHQQGLALILEVAEAARIHHVGCVEAVGKAAPAVGKIYWFEPAAGFNPRMTQGKKPIPDPADISNMITAGTTTMHFTSVVAMDGADVITSEVNAAFGERPPWFTMYHGEGAFYEAIQAVYTYTDKQGIVHKPEVKNLIFKPKK